MTDKTNLDAESVIADFLLKVGKPTAKDWDSLITRFPQFASDIVDAALVEKSRASFEARALQMLRRAAKSLLARLPGQSTLPTRAFRHN